MLIGCEVYLALGLLIKLLHRLVGLGGFYIKDVDIVCLRSLSYIDAVITIPEMYIHHTLQGIIEYTGYAVKLEIQAKMLGRGPSGMKRSFRRSFDQY